MLDGIQIDSFRARDEQEVRGYRDLLELVGAQHPTLRLTENNIKEFHRVLLAHSEKDAHHRGEYKKQSNDVQKSGDGLPVVVFRTAPPAETRWWMERLVAEFNTAWDDSRWHRLVLIADFILWFLAIHPFLDGNGRLARALTTLLLLRAEYDYAPYASLERVIEERKVEYYVALQHSQVAVRGNPDAYGEWLQFFLGVLGAQQQALESLLSTAARRQDLPAAQSKILEWITEKGSTTTPELASGLGIPARTVRYHLAQLTRRKLLEAQARTAGRRYSLPLSDTPRAIPEADALERQLEAGPVEPSPLERLLSPSDFTPLFQQQILANPNGRAYATVIVNALSTPTRPPLGDRELDSFEAFALSTAPSAVAVRANPSVGWWQLEDSPRLDKLQMWLYPRPLAASALGTRRIGRA